MRILICHNYYRGPGGTDRVFELETEALKRNGHDVIVYAKHSRDYWNFSLLRKIFFPLECIFSIRTYRELTKLIETHKPQVAHLHNIFPIISPSVYYVLKRYKIPIIQSRHDYRPLCPNGLFFTRGKICEKCKNGNTLHAVYNRCLMNSFLVSSVYALIIWIHRQAGTFKKKIDRIIAVSEFIKTKFVENGYLSSMIEVKYHFYPEKTNQQQSKQGDYFVYMGRLCQEKGLFLLLDVFAHFKDIKLKILGTGHLESVLRSHAEKNGLSNIEFLGFLTGNAYSETVQNAIAAIIPSMFYESFGMVCIDSLSLGVPVIASRIGAFPEIVEDGKNGLLYKSGDKEDLKNKISFFVENPQKAQEYGLHGIKTVQEKFGAKKNIEQLEKIYRNLL